MKSKSDIAVEKFQQGFNCAQSVLYSFCNDFNFEKNTSLKIARGFGADMGLKGEVCGAVTGGIMVLGLQYGRAEQDGYAATEFTYAKTRELVDQFIKKHGTFICRKLINQLDLSTEEGQKQFMEKDLLNKACKPCVQSVVEILENLMQ